MTGAKASNPGPQAAMELRPPFAADGGAAWMIPLPYEFHSLTDTDKAPSRSALRLLEDGRVLGPGHALHRAIRDDGHGRYSFWKEGLWFSTSDGSDPNGNRRSYSIVLEDPTGTLVAPPVRAAVGPGRAELALEGLQTQSGLLCKVFGDRHLKDCPVCHSADTLPLWRMPMANLREPINLFGGYFNQLPTLQTPGVLYCFDFCRACESIFLNPVPLQQKEQYRTENHYIGKMETSAEWKAYDDLYDSFAKWIPQDAKVMIDAACGVGQYLQLARRRGTHQWKRLIGLELAEKYVGHMRKEGIEAHSFDIDNDDLLALVEPNSVDFITFCEAFEHVERPLDALRKLVAALRPNGRLYFTAQRYGTDVNAAVRPGEPIYIGEKVVSKLPEQTGCRIVSISTSLMRYYIVVEK